jgi:hypothetical protein
VGQRDVTAVIFGNRGPSDHSSLTLMKKREKVTIYFAAKAAA